MNLRRLIPNLVGGGELAHEQQASQGIAFRFVVVPLIAPGVGLLAYKFTALGTDDNRILAGRVYSQIRG